MRTRAASGRDPRRCPDKCRWTVACHLRFPSLAQRLVASRQLPPGPGGHQTRPGGGPADQGGCTCGGPERLTGWTSQRRRARRGLGIEPRYIHPREYVWATGRIWERIFRPTIHPVKAREVEAFLRDTAALPTWRGLGRWCGGVMSPTRQRRRNEYGSHHGLPDAPAPAASRWACPTL
jgi:hypothetical protein